jgi:DNA-binding NarL/FixJ family response regulator
MRMLSILIADDYAIFRRGLRAVLEAQPGWKVVGEAASGRDAVNQATQIQPDVTILDINMPELNGLDAARLIVKAAPHTRVLALASYHTQEMIARALQAGVRGYLLKSDTEGDVVAAVKALTEGRTFFTSAASGVLLEHLRQENVPALTVRESEIVQLLAEGKSNKEVAQVLGISSRTVENHRAQIMQRLGLQSFSDLVRYAIRHGIIEL